MNLEEAVLASLTDEPQNTYLIAKARLVHQGDTSAIVHGVAATLTCLDRLERQGKVRLTKNEHGASCWSKP